MFADPINAISSSTIINLEWIYIISVTGMEWGYGDNSCFLKPKN